MQTKSLTKPLEHKAIFTALLASFLIGACAQIKIPLPFTPVPFTCQTLAVMAIGARLGSRYGALATVFYLLEGILGLPVFSGGHTGLLWILGATGGYLLSYPLEAFLVGYFIERKQRLLAIVLPCTLQMALGSLWLSAFVGLDRCFQLGFYPFFLGEIGKALIATQCYKRSNP